MLAPIMSRIRTPATRPMMSNPNPARNVSGAYRGAVLLRKSIIWSENTGIHKITLTAAMTSRASTIWRPENKAAPAAYPP